MIPLLATPILNRPDLLQRLISSIDYPVVELLVIDNGVLDLSDLKVPECVERHTVLHNSGNVGCAGAWNQAIHHAFNERRYEYVLIMGNDIQFTPGDLEKFEQAITPETDFVSGNWAFSSWGLTRQGFGKLGWVDENYEMGYLEDGDYWRRVQLTGATVASADTHMIHGEAPHWGSSTINSDPALKRVVTAAHERNWSYHIKKWGGRKEGNTERYTRPFNCTNNPIWHWELSSDRLNRPHFKTHG